ncbi:MAG: hypothetical protein HY738_07635, partial [Bacteroidia bacterium]|nr:hypothetical protein [Bacteroidia bacterium]
MKLLFIGFLILMSLYGFTQPSNDICSDATISPQDGSCINGTTVGANDNWVGIVGCQSGNNPEVWYTVTSTGTHGVWIITSGTMTGNIEFILVYGTSCAASLYLVNSTCGASPASITIGSLVPGTTYWFTISSSTGSEGTFTTCLTTSTPPPLPGQDCSTAAILCNDNTFSQATSDAGFATQEVTTSNSCWGSGGERQSKWFNFTIGASGTLEFMIDPVNYTAPQTGDDYDFSLWNGCPGATTTELACNWSGCLGATGVATDPLASFGSEGNTDWQNTNPPGPGKCVHG